MDGSGVNLKVVLPYFPTFQPPAHRSLARWRVAISMLMSKWGDWVMCVMLLCLQLCPLNCCRELQRELGSSEYHQNWNSTGLSSDF